MQLRALVTIFAFFVGAQARVVARDDAASLSKRASDPFIPDEYFEVQLESAAHRAAIVSQWDIPVGARVLEIGCGQGDTTAVLAELVGENGHVTGVDPASLDYGLPLTLSEAQARLSAGRLGNRITWVHADPLAFLSGTSTLKPTSEPYDVVVFSLSIWYFSSPSVFSAVLAALAPHAKRLCIAEWSLIASDPEAYGHVLASLAQAALEYHNPGATLNVRTIFSPAAIVRAAESPKGGGWKLVKESRFKPAARTPDGQWEVEAVLDPDFEKEMDEFMKDEQERAVVIAMRDAVRAAVDIVGGAKQVEPMDVWSGQFMRAQ